MSNTRNDAEPFVLFELAGTTYGVRSRFVQQMEMIEHITPVPNAPPAVEGVVLARGQVIPALNLRVRFGFERAPFDLRTRLMVVNHGERTLGLIVDTSREFLRRAAARGHHGTERQVPRRNRDGQGADDSGPQSGRGSRPRRAAARVGRRLTGDGHVNTDG
jgi:chemotaxis signal transduction protein